MELPPLELRRLTPSDESPFFAGLKDWSDEDLSWYTFAWRPGMPYNKMLEILENEEKGIDLVEGRVPSTMLYGFAQGAIVGRVNVRHRLNDRLRIRGGHIGYAVSPKHRRRGYATEMVKQTLLFCEQSKINPLLITCSDQNIPSWKLIENCGGVLEGTVLDPEKGELIRRYWITL